MSLSHSVYNKLISKNVSVEVIFESNPIFAGEELVTIIRFKNTNEGKHHGRNGSLARKGSNGGSSTTLASTATTTTATEDNSWSLGKRLSLSLTSTARSLFLEQLDSIDEEDDDVEHLLSETLMLGYVQLFGYMIPDSTILDSSKLTESRKNSIVGTKLAGINEFDINSTAAKQSMLNGLTTGISNILNTPIGENPSENFKRSFFMNHSSVTSSTKRKQTKQTDDIVDLIVPIFSTSQSVLFTELTLKPGEIKSFYFKSKLPANIPPNFKGKTSYITYNLIVGSQIKPMFNNNGSRFQQPLRFPSTSLYFPLKIFPHIDANGIQPVTLTNLKNLLILNNEEDSIVQLQDRFDRKASFKSIELSLSNDKNKNDRLKLIDKLNQLILNDNQATTLTPNRETLSCSESIFLFMDNSLKGMLNVPEDLDDTTHKMQLKKIQNQYTIKRNNEYVCKITLSKPLFRIGEDINMIIDFKESSVRTSGIIIALESYENTSQEMNLYENRELTNYSLTNEFIEERTKIWFNESVNVMSHLKLNKSINIPITVTPQFQSAIVNLEWYLRFKFVILEDKHSSPQSAFNNVSRDTKSGGISIGLDSLDGYDFGFRLPVIIIPTDQDLNGLL